MPIRHPSASRVSILFLAAVCLLSCSRERRPPVERILPADPAAAEVSGPVVFLPVESPLLRPTESACQAVERLRAAPGDARFSVFGRIEMAEPSTGRWQGALKVPFSPFVQLFLGESFKIDSPEEFYKKIEEEYRSGRLSAFNWWLVNLARAIPPLFRSLQYSATNGKLQENFPGLHGRPGPVGESLYLLLASKAGGVDGSGIARDMAAARILTAELPLFLGGWDETVTDVRQSLASAVASLAVQEDTLSGRQERLCGFVLWQRALAELFALKGFKSPRLVGPDGEPEKQHFKEISEEYKNPAELDVGGAFWDPRAGSQVVLTGDAIGNYDPAKEPLEAVKNPPQGLSAIGVQASPGGAEALASLLETSLQFYQATSPAAPWFSGAGSYILGDLTARTGKAILPHDAHALSLGLVVMAFNTLATRHVVEVDSRGKRLASGGENAGIVIPEQSQGQSPPGSSSDKVRVRLASIVRILRSVVHLDTALKGLGTLPAEEWASRSPVYTRSTLAKLVGRDLFTESELSQLLTADERKSVLRDQLRAIPLPLSLLALRFLDRRSGCHQEIEWDLASGRTTLLKPCSESQEKQLRDAITLLGHHTLSPVLLRRAERRR